LVTGAPICLSQWTLVDHDVSKAAADKPCHFLYEFRHFVYSTSVASHIVWTTIPPKHSTLDRANKIRIASLASSSHHRKTLYDSRMRLPAEKL
jgi:hypothetical protein